MAEMKSYRLLFCRMYNLEGLFSDVEIVFLSIYAAGNEEDLQAIIDTNPWIILSRDRVILSKSRLNYQCPHKNDNFRFDNDAFVQTGHDAMDFKSHIEFDKDFIPMDKVFICSYMMIGFYKKSKK